MKKTRILSLIVAIAIILSAMPSALLSVQVNAYDGVQAEIEGEIGLTFDEVEAVYFTVSSFLDGEPIISVVDGKMMTSFETPTEFFGASEIRGFGIEYDSDADASFLADCGIEVIDYNMEEVTFTFTSYPLAFVFVAIPCDVCEEIQCICTLKAAIEDAGVDFDKVALMQSYDVTAEFEGKAIVGTDGKIRVTLDIPEELKDGNYDYSFFGVNFDWVAVLSEKAIEIVEITETEITIELTEFPYSIILIAVPSVGCEECVGGTIANPNYPMPTTSSLVINGNVLAEVNGESRPSLEIDILALIEGTGIEASEVSGIEATIWSLGGAGSGNTRQLFVAVNDVRSPLFRTNATPAQIEEGEIFMPRQAIHGISWMFNEEQLATITEEEFIVLIRNNNAAWGVGPISLLDADGNVLGTIEYSTQDKDGEWGNFVAAECRHTDDCDHDLTFTTVEPTCTEGGTNTGICSKCDFVGVVTIEALGHDYGEYSGDTATCTEGGTESATCSRGDAVDTRETTAKGHTYGETPDCQDECDDCEDIFKCATYCIKCAPEKFCPVCKEEYVDGVCATCVCPNNDGGPHDLEEVEVTAATCTEKGSKEVSCKLCELATVTVELPAKGHVYGADVTVPSTCTVVGVVKAVCTVCSYENVKQNLPIAAHVFETYAVTTPATCAAKGEETATCKNCPATDKKDLPLADHVFGAYEETTPATCDEEGEETATCENCAATDKREIEKSDHTLSHVVTATCTEGGTNTGTCSECDFVGTVTVEALGHDFNLETAVCGTTECNREGCTAKFKCVIGCPICNVPCVITTCTDPSKCTHYTKGDVNGNGKVDIEDAVQILCYLAKLNSLLKDDVQYQQYAWRAAKIMPASITANKPAIQDAVDILCFLAKLNSVIKPL